MLTGLCSSLCRILRTLCRKLRLPGDFDFQQLARLTPGYVGADLMALCREAAVSAVNRVLLERQEGSQESPAPAERTPESVQPETQPPEGLDGCVVEPHTGNQEMRDASPAVEEEVQPSSGTTSVQVATEVSHAIGHVHSTQSSLMGIQARWEIKPQCSSELPALAVFWQNGCIAISPNSFRWKDLSDSTFLV